MIIPNSICELKNILKIEKINKGYSDDEKYYVENKDRSKLLLKISSSDIEDKKQEEFDSTRLVYNTGIPMSKPINIYIIDDKVYSIFTWCNGCELNDLLDDLPAKKQYELGLRAGSYLKMIHSINLKIDTKDWYSKFKSKKNSKIKNYQSCPIKFDYDYLMIDYLNNNEDLLLNRPQTFQHGDFHPGNMVYDDTTDTLSIIDFNRFDYADPFEEFNRIDLAANISPYFATGQIDGYFDNNPPKIFFDLLLYYITANALSSIPWAIAFGDKEVNVMLDKIDKTLFWFDNMANSSPIWYNHNF